jgi:hypothetical protein
MNRLNQTEPAVFSIFVVLCIILQEFFISLYLIINSTVRKQQQQQQQQQHSLMFRKTPFYVIKNIELFIIIKK